MVTQSQLLCCHLCGWAFYWLLRLLPLTMSYVVDQRALSKLRKSMLALTKAMSDDDALKRVFRVERIVPWVKANWPISQLRFHIISRFYLQLSRSYCYAFSSSLRVGAKASINNAIAAPNYRLLHQNKQLLSYDYAFFDFIPYSSSVIPP